MRSIEDNKVVRYLYEFGMDNKLHKATIYFDTETKEIFNRSNEIELGNYENKNKAKSG